MRHTVYDPGSTDMDKKNIGLYIPIYIFRKIVKTEKEKDLNSTEKENRWAQKKHRTKSQLKSSLQVLNERKKEQKETHIYYYYI